MKCPFCSFADSKVVDSRPDKGGATIRRRRECESCGKRFTTHERIEEILPLVLKKDGRREPFDFCLSGCDVHGKSRRRTYHRVEPQSAVRGEV